MGAAPGQGTEPLAEPHIRYRERISLLQSDEATLSAPSQTA